MYPPYVVVLFGIDAVGIAIWPYVRSTSAVSGSILSPASFRTASHCCTSAVLFTDFVMALVLTLRGIEPVVDA